MIFTFQMSSPSSMKISQGSKENISKPPTPDKSSKFIRKLSDEWSEYINEESGRHFFFNRRLNRGSWKPPRSIGRKSDDSFERNSNSSSFDKSLDSLPLGSEVSMGSSHNFLDVSCAVPKRGREGSTQGSNNDLNSQSDENCCSSDVRNESTIEESVDSIVEGDERLDPKEIPRGWKEELDEGTNTYCYVNQDGEKVCAFSLACVTFGLV